MVRDRLAALERSAEQAVLGQLTDPARKEASDLAHKFTGSLGMFGFPRGTEIARELEQMLEPASALDPELYRQRCADLRSVLPL